MRIDGEYLFLIERGQRQTAHHINGWIKLLFKCNVHWSLEYFQAAITFKLQREIYPPINQQALVCPAHANMPLERANNFNIVIGLEIFFVKIVDLRGSNRSLHQLRQIINHTSSFNPSYLCE